MMRGFSLIELLIATTICAIVSAIVAIVVPPARAAFEITPATIDLQQRGRVAVDAIAQAIRGAGGDAVAAEEFGPLSGIVPAVIPFDAVDGRFTKLKVIAPQLHGGQGVLDHHQASAAGSLSLGSRRCPAASVVCGFAPGATALIADGSGRFDVFEVASADGVSLQLVADRSLVPPYVAGSVVIEADIHTFLLETQPDGSRTLVRASAAGATQPVVDRVSDLRFELYEIDDTGALTRMPVDVFTDGPWLRGEPDGVYDEDLLRVRRVDIVLTVHALSPAIAQQTVRFGVFMRNVP